MESRYYVVKRGDTLWGIARHFGVSLEALTARNGLSGKRANHIAIGQKIYLPGDATSSPDLRLSMRVTGLSGKPIKQAKLKLTHDGKTTETQANQNGWLHALHIFDHVQGLKVEFETYDRQWRTIFDEKILPLGDKVLHINTLTELIKGRTVRKDGATLVPKKRIGAEIRKQTPQPGAVTTPKTPLPHVPATPIVTDTRTDDGMPVTIIAPVFSSENLLLPKPNEKFRQALIDSAKRYGFTPQALAAIVDAEAAKDKKILGAWKEDGASSSSSARGLGQFLPAAWYQYVAKPGTLGNAEALKLLGAAKLHAEYGKLYKIDGDKKSEVNVFRLNTILSWRDHGGYSIDAIASYAEDNLALLKRKGIDATSLPPDEKVKIAYIMHHEGPEDGELFLRGMLGKTKKSDTENVKRKLARQFRTKEDDGTAQAKQLADRFKGDYIKAYYYFLANHADNVARVTNFMLTHDGFSERPIYDVIQKFAGLHIEIPPPVSSSKRNVERRTQPQPKEVGEGVKTGGVPGWADPLERCKIRIGGYADSESNPASARAKSLFLGRGGKHKGIDIDAEPGTAVRSVANSRVFFAGNGRSYGQIIVLSVSVNDLPEAQRNYAQTHLRDPHQNTIFFLYAHLSEIQVKLGSYIECGQIIGNTGDSGIAEGMVLVGPYSTRTNTEKQYGAHLHFEARITPSLKKGEGKWIDPKPFLLRCE